jgi:holliday junction DNA helicase RuvA
MIASLRGNIIDRTANAVVIDVGGVGYLVAITPTHAADLTTNATTSLIIHTIVREDSLTLYGFRTKEERSLFQALIGISGVGPKTALTVLSLAAPREIMSAIQAGDSSVLTKVSGIGRKTADRIIIELREKVGSIGLPTAGPEAEVIDALVGLGYSIPEARDAVRAVRGTSTDSGELLKAALKQLSKH